jgi:hypothetical protein
MLLSLLLAACLAAGLHASQTDESADVLPQADIVESYTGLENVADEESPEPDTEEGEGATTPDSTSTGGRRGHRGRGGHGRRGHRHHHHDRPNGNWTADQKMDFICRAIESPEAGRKARDITARLERLSDDVRANLTSLLAARKAEMVACCALAGDARTSCVETLREQRLDRICRGEEPPCIWSLIKRGSSSSSSSSGRSGRSRSNSGPQISQPIASPISACCDQTGADRANCFSTARRTAWRQRQSERHAQLQATIQKYRNSLRGIHK